jgi:hypothetical protein
LIAVSRKKSDLVHLIKSEARDKLVIALARLGEVETLLATLDDSLACLDCLEQS